MCGQAGLQRVRAGIAGGQRLLFNVGSPVVERARGGRSPRRRRAGVDRVRLHDSPAGEQRGGGVVVVRIVTAGGSGTAPHVGMSAVGRQVRHGVTGQTHPVHVPRQVSVHHPDPAVQRQTVGRAGQAPAAPLEVVRLGDVVESQPVHHAVHGLQRLALAPEPPRSSSKGALLEHELAGRVDSPVVALPWPAEALGQLDEALVQGQVMAHGVLPSLIRASEKREAALQELVDFTERQPLGRRALDRHDY